MIFRSTLLIYSEEHFCYETGEYNRRPHLNLKNKIGRYRGLGEISK